ncbi:hypothetical protein GIB67_003642, partial [Kingdonia uniflora]
NRKSDLYSNKNKIYLNRTIIIRIHQKCIRTNKGLRQFVRIKKKPIRARQVLRSCLNRTKASSNRDLFFSNKTSLSFHTL